MVDETPSLLELNWKITGKAGEGVMLGAKLFAQIIKRHGLVNFTYLEYPSLIKGGHQTGQVFASSKSATCQKRALDVLIAINTEGMKQHLDELTPETVVIYNSDAGQIDETAYRTKTTKIFALPLFSLAKEATGDLIATNVICLALSSYLFGLDQALVKQSIQDDLAGKPPEVITKNIQAFEAGWKLAGEKLGAPIKTIGKSEDQQILFTGNEAMGLGAIAGGVQFYSAYPMTPASGLLHYLAEQQTHYPLVVKHAEDEIGAINQAIGASFAGVRAMTGTSGGGLALMTEAVSLASVTETPLVILNAQRVGPATGLPTWTQQADLMFVLNMGHGEIERIVLTPGTVEEHFHLTKLAFDLAEKYQLPVFILSDKFALESYHTMKKIEASSIERQSLASTLPADGSFRRYKLTDDGISPRSLPGQANGYQLTNSYEHDEFGFSTEEAQPTQNQAQKRARKLQNIDQVLPQPVLLGPSEAKLTLVSWGSTVLVLSQLLNQMPDVNVIHLPRLWPFPVTQFTALAQKAKKLVMVEGNQSGQAERLIRQASGITFSDHIRRFDGRPFYSEDLIGQINNLLT